MMQGGFRISGSRKRRAAAETLVPMINIVFLLLIFFLLSATIAPPDPFDVTLPGAASRETADTAGPSVLHVSAEGELAYGDLRGDAALAALISSQQNGPETVVLKADAGLDGGTFARLLTRLSEAGVNDLNLTVNHR